MIRPSSAANQAIKGTLGRAQRYTGLRVVACVFLSNHYHLLVVPESEKQLADFMRFLNTNLSKQLGRLHNWSGSLFQRRYQAIPVSDVEAAQVSRLRYLLEHGAKENLVDRPEDWPGVHCVGELAAGTSELWGIWHERTRIWNARQAGRKLKPGERVTRETLKLSPLPAWQSKPRGQRRVAAKDLLAHIQNRLRSLRSAGVPTLLGARAICAQDPHDRPGSSKRSPAPIAHAASVAGWLEMKLAYRSFVKHYREAAQRANAGLKAHFPAGCFLPTGVYLARHGPA